MASIASLLNPEPQDATDRMNSQLPTPCPSSSRVRDPNSPSPPRQKKQRVAKDAAVFTRGKPRGEVRYPPCEYQDAKLAEEHKRHQIHPMGSITEFPRHIPYNSEKKSFLEKTGRESFEVFQYNFKVPGDDKTYLMMWDYNIGLVRTTPLFRCNNYAKTAPAKMLNQNPGLREVCHSITGGSLAAQGYWMPFEAAKAVAATFCWRIRYALTPVFGVDFLSMCIPPSDPRFGRMVIDPAIVEAVTETARRYRLLEPPVLRRHPYTTIRLDNKELHRSKHDGGRVEEVDSDYATESDTSERNGASYNPPRRAVAATSGWTPANAPRTHPARDAADRPTLPSPREILASLTAAQQAQDTDYSTALASRRPTRKRHTISATSGTSTNHHATTAADTGISDVEDDDILRAGDGDAVDEDGDYRRDRGQARDEGRNNGNSECDTLTSADREHNDLQAGGEMDVDDEDDDDDDDDQDSHDHTSDVDDKPRCRSPLPLTNDARAAYMLMRLHMQEVLNQADDEGSRKRRRASA
ncbi:hypothetical protein VTO42DRAFT_4406 [Malbranchea cinnamomea]